MTVEIEFEEAREILRLAIIKDGKTPSDFPADTQALAINGIVNMFRTAQEMGYVIKRPGGSIFTK
jgi:hypothetical protein